MRRIVLMLAVLTGCATEPLVADYAADCEVAEDCEVVIDQGYCGRCSGWAALTVDAAAEFFDDQARYTRAHSCGAVILPGCFDMGISPFPTCEAQTCAVTWTVPEEEEAR